MTNYTNKRNICWHFLWLSIRKLLLYQVTEQEEVVLIREKVSLPWSNKNSLFSLLSKIKRLAHLSSSEDNFDFSSKSIYWSLLATGQLLWKSQIAEMISVQLNQKPPTGGQWSAFSFQLYKLSFNDASNGIMYSADRLSELIGELILSITKLLWSTHLTEGTIFGFGVF